MDSIEKTFGQRVRYYRQRNKLSQEKLAERCDLHPTYIGQLERGEKNASLETIFQLCRGLDLSPETLLANIMSGSGDEAPRQAYNIFLEIPPDKQEAALGLLTDIKNMLV